MAQAAGIIIERTLRGKPRYARIDLRKFGGDERLADFFNHNGIILSASKYTDKLQKAMNEADNGEYVTRSIDEVLNL